MSGPWGLLFKKMTKAAAKEVGNRMGSVVKADTAAGNEYLRKQAWEAHKKAFDSELAKDIHDLASSDSGVSPSWIEKLIDSTKDPAQLKSISGYLTDMDRTYNLTNQMRGRLLAKATSKIEAIQDQAIMKSLIGFIRDHGGDLF